MGRTRVLSNRDMMRLMAIAKKRMAENEKDIETAKCESNGSSCPQLTEHQKDRVTAWAMANRQNVGHAIWFARLRLAVAEKVPVVIAKMKAWEEEKALRALIAQAEGADAEAV